MLDSPRWNICSCIHNLRSKRSEIRTPHWPTGVICRDTHTLSELPSLCLLLSLQDIFKHCSEGGKIEVTEIPYFEGDFWPNVIEKNIEELNQEAKDRKELEQASREVGGGVGGWRDVGGR